jgi:hypothetical protein
MTQLLAFPHSNASVTNAPEIQREREREKVCVSKALPRFQLDHCQSGLHVGRLDWCKNENLRM